MRHHGVTRIIRRLGGGRSKPRRADGDAGSVGRTRWVGQKHVGKKCRRSILFLHPVPGSPIMRLALKEGVRGPLLAPVGAAEGLRWPRVLRGCQRFRGGRVARTCGGGRSYFFMSPRLLLAVGRRAGVWVSSVCWMRERCGASRRSAAEPVLSSLRVRYREAWSRTCVRRTRLRR